MAVAKPVEPSVMESRKPSTMCKTRMPTAQTTRNNGGDAWTADQSARDAASKGLRKDEIRTKMEAGALSASAVAGGECGGEGGTGDAADAAAGAADGDAIAPTASRPVRPLFLEALAASLASASAAPVALQRSRVLEMKTKASLDHDRYMKRNSATIGPRQAARREHAR